MELRSIEQVIKEAKKLALITEVYKEGVKAGKEEIEISKIYEKIQTRNK